MGHNDQKKVAKPAANIPAGFLPKFSVHKSYTVPQKMVLVEALDEVGVNILVL